MGKAEPLYNDEVIVWEVNEDFCREKITFINNSGSTNTYGKGQALEFFTPNYGPCATAANATGVLMTDVGSLANNGTYANAVAVLRGPAIINKDKLVVGAVNLANILTALAAKDIQQKAEVIKSTTFAA